MTNQNTSPNPFDLWKDMFQKSTEAWSQAAGPAGGFTQPSGFGPFQGFNAFPSNDPQQMWQQFFSSWSDQWTKNQAGRIPGSPEAVDGTVGVDGPHFCRNDGFRCVLEYAGQIPRAIVDPAAAVFKGDQASSRRHIAGLQPSVAQPDGPAVRACDRARRALGRSGRKYPQDHQNFERHQGGLNVTRKAADPCSIEEKQKLASHRCSNVYPLYRKWGSL